MAFRCGRVFKATKIQNIFIYIFVEEVSRNSGSGGVDRILYSYLLRGVINCTFSVLVNVFVFY